MSKKIIAVVITAIITLGSLAILLTGCENKTPSQEFYDRKNAIRIVESDSLNALKDNVNNLLVDNGYDVKDSFITMGSIDNTVTIRCVVLISEDNKEKISEFDIKTNCDWPIYSALSEGAEWIMVEEKNLYLVNYFEMATYSLDGQTILVEEN